MRIKVEGKKSALINKSTKCSKYEDAYVFAVDEFNRISTAVRLGKGIQTWTFQKHWEDWYKRNIDSGGWRDERANWHLKYFNRYFNEYFTDARTKKSMLLDDIDVDYAQRYFEWRLAYWNTEANAKKLKYNPKRRDAKTRATFNA